MKQVPLCPNLDTYGHGPGNYEMTGTKLKAYTGFDDATHGGLKTDYSDEKQQPYSDLTATIKPGIKDIYCFTPNQSTLLPLQWPVT